MYRLTTILLITIHIIDYVHHRYYAHVLQHSNNIATIVYKRTENVTDTKSQIIYMMNYMELNSESPKVLTYFTGGKRYAGYVNSQSNRNMAWMIL